MDDTADRGRIAARKLAGASPACASRSARASRRSSAFSGFGSKDMAAILAEGSAPGKTGFAVVAGGRFW